MNLLSEHEVTRILQIVASIAERLEVQEHNVPELDERVKDVKPEVVLDRLDEQEKQIR